LCFDFHLVLIFIQYDELVLSGQQDKKTTPVHRIAPLQISNLKGKKPPDLRRNKHHFTRLHYQTSWPFIVTLFWIAICFTFSPKDPSDEEECPLKRKTLFFVVYDGWKISNCFEYLRFRHDVFISRKLHEERTREASHRREKCYTKVFKILEKNYLN